jgi:hypothetical protein
MRSSMIKEAIMSLTFDHPDWSTSNLVDELIAIGFDPPSRFLVASVKQTFKNNLRFLIDHGAVDSDQVEKAQAVHRSSPRPKAPEVTVTPRAPIEIKSPDRVRRMKKKRRRRPDPPVLYRHYYAGKDDD